MITSTKNHTKKRQRIVLVGIPASPGYAMGHCHTISNREVTVVEETLPNDRLAQEEQLFLKAVNNTIKELAQIKQITVNRLGIVEGSIFDAHLMILKDPTLVNGILDQIKKENKNAQWAVHTQITQLISTFESHKSALMRDRAMDLKDLYHRLMGALDDSGPVIIGDEIGNGVILVAHELNPSTLILKKNQVIAFATDSGGRTSHVSILARSMEIPAVSGLRNVSAMIQPEDNIIVDGTGGMIIINPNEEDIRKFEEKLEVFKRQQRELFTMRQLEPMTRDGKYITLHANIELTSEADKVLDYGAMELVYTVLNFVFRKGSPFRRTIRSVSIYLNALLLIVSLSVL